METKCLKEKDLPTLTTEGLSKKTQVLEFTHHSIDFACENTPSHSLYFIVIFLFKYS